MARCSTFERCAGRIGALACPYAAAASAYCRIHASAPSSAPRIHKKTPDCSLCASKKEAKPFECKKHAYCSECAADASAFDACPICLSLADDVL